MRIDVMTAADKYGCNHGTLRNLFKRGGIEGKYESSRGRNGKVQRRLTFDEADLEAAFAGPLSHIAKRAGKVTAEAINETRLDIQQAVELYNCSESRIRQSFRRGVLRGEYMMFRGRDGRLVRKLTFDKKDLDECFESEVTARRRHEEHVAKIRATAMPLTDEQKSAIASVFIEHLQEKYAAELEEGDDLFELDDDDQSHVATSLAS
jgi:hypothetical protein